jgi:coenzyme F420 hydrogenase subunit beta
MQQKENLGKAQTDLKDEVLQNELCTGCSACVHLCPYFEHHRDKTVILHGCDGSDGRCYAYCPRTPTDLSALQSHRFDPKDLTPELGAVKSLLITRAADPAIRAAAQHGGTVTALMGLALAEGIIDTAVLAGRKDPFLTESTVLSREEEVLSRAKTQFVVSPTVGTFNEAASRDESRRIGVVATPCQALALAKMQNQPASQDVERISKLKLVIGLFCGWALSWEHLKPLLDAHVGHGNIHKIDIPPSQYRCMEVTTDTDKVCIPLSEVETCVRESCRYCFDQTCEFSDLSVGSARSAEGWEVDRGWNQTLVRTALGERLVELARTRGVLEFKETPAGNLEKLKAASLKKKRGCLKHLGEKSGRPDDLIYLHADDPVVKAWLEETNGGGD